MLIQCPFCHAQARLSENQEGAKVRCGECEKTYTARPKGARSKQRDRNVTTRIAIMAGAVVVLGVLFVLIRSGSSDDVRPVAAASAPPPAPDPVPIAPVSPWDSEPVLAVRDLYEAVAAYDDARALGRLDLARVHLARQDAGAPAFEVLSPTEQAAFREHVLDELTDRSLLDAIGGWKPFDGEVVRSSDSEALVHMKVNGLSDETSLETRTMAWTLAREPGLDARWRASAWERVFTEDELRAQRKAAQRRVEHVQLSDGSTVFEAVPEPLEHLDSSSLELRAEIDSLYVQLIDLTLAPRANADAKAALVLLGGPTLPVLLTGLFEIKLETQDEAIQVNLINQCLEEITGHYTGYRPQVLEGSATGTSAERRDSAIKQWFAWWHRDGAKFLAGSPNSEGSSGGGPGD